MAQRLDVRARDIDRAIACTALDNAYAEGQLTFDEHRLRIERSRAAATLSDLRRLVSDLQISVDLPEPELPARAPRRRVVLALASVVVVVAGLVVFLANRGSDDSPASTVSESSAAAPTDAIAIQLPGDTTPIVARPFVFDTAAGLGDLRARYEERFGSSEVLEVSIQPDESDRADVYRVSADGRRERVFVDGGFAVEAGSSVLDAAELPFDWALVDSTALAGLIAGTPETVGVPDAVVEYITIDLDAGVQRISISASDPDRRGGRVVADFAGNILSVNRYTI